MIQNEPGMPVSVLERCILDALRSCRGQRATIGELAQRTNLPEGTVRFSLQWLLACRLVRYEEQLYHLRNEADAD